MPFRPCRWCAAFLSLLALSVPAFAQERDPAPPAPDAAIVPTPAPVVGRNRIGLALAGGGALGEAHIGVLQWLEEHHIPVDYVAGTSIGGLVGGAYASGYAPSDLQALLTRLDWQQALSGDTPYPALAFRRKEDRRVIPNRFEFGLKRGLTLPGGLNPAHTIGLLLSEIAYPVSTVPSFDALPIPFRCVATDLQTGDSVVMKDGSLAVALRATMSLPAIFTPVRRDGRLLSDGGIGQNLPTEVVRDMGAQTIIAVDLSASSVKANETDQLGSILTIIGRSVTLAIRANERVSLKLANVVVAPDFAGLSGGDFAQVAEYAKRGYAAAEAQKASLLPLAVSDADWQTYVAARQTRRGDPPPRPAFFAVTGTSGVQASRVATQLRPLLGKPFPSPDADNRLTLLTGSGRYNAVLYEATRNIQGVAGVRIRAQETDYGPPFLRGGLEINGANTRAVQVNAVARYIGFDVGVPDAESRIDVSLGSVNRLASEYLLPITAYTASPLYLAPRAFVAENSRDLFQSDTRPGVFGSQEVGLGVDAVFLPNRFAEVRTGYALSRFSSGLRDASGVATPTGTVGTVRLSGVYDGLDDAAIPRSGFRSSLFVTRYLKAPGDTRPFYAAEAQTDIFRTRPKSNNTLFGLLRGGTTFGATVPAPLQFSLGGPFRLGSENVNTLRGNNYFAATGGILHTVSTSPLLGGRTLVGVWGELGGVSDTRACLSAAIISETFLGPVLIGTSIGDNQRGGVRFVPYFTLGRLF